MAVAVLVAAFLSGACVTPKRTVAAPSQLVPAPAGAAPAGSAQGQLGRPRVGVAFGGGSARGLAHIGVIRWLEEHRVPIDLVAGTSMGGLVGGSFATGLDAAELNDLLSTLDWNAMFGSSNFAYKNIRRKTDARAFPSRIEFGIQGGLVPPTALNNGQQVDMLLSRITAPYYGIESFNELPTPFSSVAVDLVQAKPVILNRGSLAQAMRATMSLPLIFPPVELDGQLLVDGGAMNNVPADVVRAMGADRVIAVNVGELDDAKEIDDTMLGLAGATIDAMMRDSTRKAMAGADVVINVPLTDYGSLDWRRSDELAEEGYRAAEALRDQLLPLALGDAEYGRWKAARQDRRRRTLPTPTFVEVEGVAAADSRRMRAVLRRHVGTSLDIPELEKDITILTGVDRYDAITWRMVQNDAGSAGLIVRGRPKMYAPPFMMLGINMENTTSSDFHLTLTGRYLTYGFPTSGAELRVDGTIGSNPAVGAELYLPIGASPLFVAPSATLTTSTFDIIRDDEVLARYNQRFERLGLAVGTNLGAKSDLRLGAFVGHTKAQIDVGDPIFPQLSGRETGAQLAWRYDSQDSPVVPSQGALISASVSQVFDNPDIILSDSTVPFDDRITQLSAAGTRFWSLGPLNRVFATGGFGRTWNGDPLPHNQFVLGLPFHLGAYETGELFGPNYYAVSGGYLRQVARLPDFIGGPIFAGAWLENADAFEAWNEARWRSNASVGLVMDTIIGPVMLGGSAGFDGRWRTFVGIGRLVRER
jgi:NTE family protein